MPPRIPGLGKAMEKNDWLPHACFGKMHPEPVDSGTVVRDSKIRHVRVLLRTSMLITRQERET